ncbi:MAG: putative porin [Lentisphaeria bacterium]|nr:putative porin [Lentisphaeria bacterium]
MVTTKRSGCLSGLARTSHGKLLLTLFLCGWVVSSYGQDNAAVLQQIEAMKQQIQLQQEQLNMLQQKLEQQQNATASVQQEIKAVAEKSSVAASDLPRVILGKGIDGLKIQGDLRLRYEHINTDLENSEDLRYKSRFRHRVRLGGVWTNPAEDWEIGLGLEAGSSDGTSANDSWNQSSVWESGSVYLDYAYAKHTFGDSGLSLTLGQQKNPWTCGMVNFDGDLRPTGATLAWKNDLLFANIGAYNIRGDNSVTGSGSSQDLANMYGGQIGMNWENDDLKALLAFGFFAYDDNTSEYQMGSDEANYQIGMAYGELGGKIGDVAVKGFAEVAMNFGADDDFSQGAAYGRAPTDPADYSPESNDLAWMLGVEAKLNRFKAKYAYAHIEGDSVPWFVSDSDFGSGALRSSRSVNVQGHTFGLTCDISKNFSIGGTVMLTDLIEAKDDGDADGMLYQLDMSYKF